MFGDTATGRIDRVIGKFQKMVDGLNKSIEELKDTQQVNKTRIQELLTDNEVNQKSIDKAASVRDKLVKIIE